LIEMNAPATLQISLAPTDLPHAKVLLPHQLRAWSGQVNEVVLSVDGHKGPAGGRFTEGWEERRPGLDALLAKCCRQSTHVRVAEVDYGQEARRQVAERFFDGAPLPEKDSRGGPFYSYFHGLHEAANDLVLHIDSDLLFGGGSQRWIEEASALIAQRQDALACNPLGGPPTADRSRWHDPVEPHTSLAFRCSSISTRLFLVDRRRLAPLPLRPPARARSRAKARLHGNPAFALPEELLTSAMHERGMVRIDLLGEDPGMWSLHPPYRSATFYAGLDALVRRVETGDVPDEQRGDFDVNDSLVDWSDARAAFRRRRWIS